MVKTPRCCGDIAKDAPLDIIASSFLFAWVLVMRAIVSHQEEVVTRAVKFRLTAYPPIEFSLG